VRDGSELSAEKQLTSSFQLSLDTKHECRLGLADHHLFVNLMSVG
jgi:hypothetical protein